MRAARMKFLYEEKEWSVKKIAALAEVAVITVYKNLQGLNYKARPKQSRFTAAEKRERTYAATKRWRQNHREAYNAYQREYYAKNRKGGKLI